MSTTQSTLTKNAHVFDGDHEGLIRNASVLIEGNIIKEISTRAISAPDAAVIDAGGRVMTRALSTRTRTSCSRCR